MWRIAYVANMEKFKFDIHHSLHMECTYIIFILAPHLLQVKRYHTNLQMFKYSWNINGTWNKCIAQIIFDIADHNDD